MKNEEPNLLLAESRKQLYFDGHTNIDLISSSLLDNLLLQLKELDLDNLEENDLFISNYQMTFDLKRNASLNKILIELLFDQDLLNKINTITGREYVLGDIVLRKSLNKKSYMPWHRDTYIDSKGSLIGRVPPLLKIMFYPCLDGSPSHELTILTGTTKFRFKNYYLEKLMHKFFRFNSKKIFQSNYSCELIDSSIVHSAIPSKPGSNGSFRLIYNFCDQSQLDTFSDATIIHEQFNDIKNNADRI